MGPVSVLRGRGWLGPAPLMLSLLCGTLPVSPLVAQNMAASVEVQVPLLLKTISFDRSRVAGTGHDLVVGVLYQGKYRASAEVASGVRRTLESLPQSGVGAWTLRLVLIDLDDAGDLDSILTHKRVSVLYVSPLRAASLRRITDATRASRVTTVTGVPGYVDAGLSIGIDVQEDRPRIIMNLAASQAEGAQFSSQLLHLARLVDRNKHDD